MPQSAVLNPLLRCPNLKVKSNDHIPKIFKNYRNVLEAAHRNYGRDGDMITHGLII